MPVLNEADALFLGADPVERVYLGADQVWPLEAEAPRLDLLSKPDGGNRSFGVPGVAFSTIATLAGSTNRKYTPLVVNKEIRLTHLAYEVTTALAGATIQVAIYHADESWQPVGRARWPGGFALDVVQVYIHALSAGFTLEPGRYVVATQQTSATPTVRRFCGGTRFFGVHGPTTNAGMTSTAEVVTALPMPDPGVPWSTVAQAGRPPEHSVLWRWEDAA